MKSCEGDIEGSIGSRQLLSNPAPGLQLHDARKRPNLTTLLDICDDKIPCEVNEQRTILYTGGSGIGKCPPPRLERNRRGRRGGFEFVVPMI